MTPSKAKHFPTLASVLLVAGAIVVAYYNSFSGVFVFDDDMSITNNVSIRHLWPAGPVLNPPTDGGRTVGGRPILNLTLALNYAAGGTSVWGYHAVNLAIHLIAALLLFGIVRRTLGKADGSSLTALCAALLWGLHPLQTEAVTYLVQRAESLMGLFYFLTLYAFIRSDRTRLKGWAALSVVSCLLGMGTKEVMVSAPFMVFFYDRVFVAGSWKKAWTERRGYYTALASTWIALGYLVAAAHGRGGSSGFGSGVSWSSYVLTQPAAILQYLKLALWPSPLVFDYGTRWASSVGSVLPAALALAALGAGVIWAVVRKPALGFLGVWFFAILAPTSLVPGARMTMADHRMYLALAPVAVLASIGLARLPGKASRWVMVPLPFLLLVLTARRNGDYASEIRLWTDTVEKRPDNVFARENLGGLYFHGGQPDRAIAEYREALLRKPDYPEAQNNWGMVLASQGKDSEAIFHYEQAVALKKDYPEALNNWGIALSAEGRGSEAVEKLQEALRLKPDYPEAENNLGLAYAHDGNWLEAIRHYETALKARPDMAEFEENLGLAFAYSGNVQEALVHFQRSVLLNPNDAGERNALGTALRSSGRSKESVEEYETALKLKPDYPDAAFNLGNALSDLGETERAISSYRLALTLRPAYAEADLNLGLALAGSGKPDEALKAYQAALAVRPAYAQAHTNLGNLLMSLGRMQEAAAEFEAASRSR